MPTPRPEPRGLYPKHLGRYELLVPIGTGGMATVFLARCPVIDGAYREVALKILHPHVAADDGGPLRELIEEAKVAARIRHPNVIPVLSVERQAELVGLVMDYVEGETLAGLVRAEKARGSQLPLPIAARILFDALAGLHAAHELADDEGRPIGLVHRDFSPQNILVGVDGIARLTDFGVAKVASRAQATQTGMVKGKIGYMAPEQALGRPLDRRCDVWAAGVVAWELLAGKRLFEGEQVAVMLRVVQEIPPRVRSERPDVPPEIDDIIATALDPDASRRFESADVFRRRLVGAWRAASATAENAEVAEYVREACSERLAARRARVASVIADGGAAIPIEGAVDIDDAPTEVAGAEPGGAQPIPAVARPTPGRRLLFAGVGAFAVAATLVGVAIRAERETAMPPAASAGLAEQARAVSEALPTGPREESLVVRGDRPVAEVRVGRRSVTVDPPAREVTVPLLSDERGRDLDLVIVAEDRAFVAHKASAHTGHIEVAFPPAESAAQPVALTPLPPKGAPPKGAPPKGAPPQTSDPPPKKDPGLAPTPY